MKFLLAAAILTIAVTVEGSTRCQRGIYYWCKSESTAQECMKTRYCQDSMWKNKVIAIEKNVDVSVECQQCKELVREMNHMQTNNIAESEVKTTLKEVCSSAFAESSTCNILNPYLDQIWNLFANEGLDYESVCSKVELCSISLMTTSSKMNGFECTICNLVAMEALKNINGGILQEAAKDMAKKASVYLGDFASEWPNLIDMFGDKIYSSIISVIGNKFKPQLDTICGILPCNIAMGCNIFINLGLDIVGNKVISSGEVCKSLRLCKSDMTAILKNREKNMFVDDTCEICKIFARFSNTKFKPDLKSTLGKMCESFTGSWGRKCSSLVNKLDMDWDTLKQAIESGEICEILKVCKSSTRSLKLMNVKVTNPIKAAFNFVKGTFEFFSGNIVKPFTSFFDKISSFFIEEVPNVPMDMCKMFQVLQFSKNPPFDNKTKNMKNAAICDHCKMAAFSVLPLMDKKKEITSFLKRVCLILPIGIRSDCYNEVISEDFGLGWDILKQEIESGGICDILQECKTSTTRSLKKIRLGGFFHKLFDFFRKIFDFRRIFHRGLKDIQQETASYVRINSKGLELEQPNIMRVNFRRLELDQTMPKTALCDICKMVAMSLKPYMDNKMEIKSDLLRICKILPSSIGSYCSTEVNSNKFDLVFDILKAMIESGRICGIVQCKSSTTRSLNKTMPKTALCDICKMVAISLKPYMETKTEIKSDLLRICKTLPSSISSYCSTEVNSNKFDLVFYILKEMIGSGRICGIVQCKSSTTLSPNKTEIKSALEWICKALPNNVGRDCYDRVNSNDFDMVMDILTQAIDLGDICDIVKECQSSKSRSLKIQDLKVIFDQFVDFFKKMFNRIFMIFEQENEAPNTAPCDYCKLVAIFLKPYVENKMKIKSALEVVCKSLPSNSGRICNNQVNSNEFDLGLDILKQEIDSGGICYIVQACQSSSSRSLKIEDLKGIFNRLIDFFKKIFGRIFMIFEKQSEMSNTDLCDSCKMATIFLKPYMEDKELIKSSLDGICKAAPSNIGRGCYDQVNSNDLDVDLDILKLEVDSGGICGIVQACQSSTSRSLKSQDLKGIFDKLVNFFKKIFDRIFMIFEQENSSRVKITELVCNSLPEEMKSKVTKLCSPMLDEEVPNAN